ncbi:DUF5103 domain-containing protein [Rudanella lutea]|uniref:type IX secretion system plug protein n=1 Tax=Rudanella lutea TaxID=451374 RepID=UPI000370BC8C|nr:DUF5103 domain-containing protein [Rudanella lutea]
MTAPNRYVLLLTSWLWAAAFGSLVAQPLETADVNYDTQIQTVLLYPAIGGDVTSPARTLNPPVTELNTDSPLVLEFDDLSGDYRPFRARLVHCNADWQKSVLNDIEFTYEFNDYPITEYQVSMGTKVQYYHYRFQVPKVKLPGNYMLVVVNERNPRQLILSRRFSTYQNRVSVGAAVQFSSSPQRQFRDQQIDLTLNYKGYQVISPQDDFKIIIRQNYRDDRIITGLKPTNVRVFDQVLEYHLFDLTNTIPGSNEYRFFDTRTVLSRSNFVDRIVPREDKTTAYVMIDQPRSVGGYIQFDDFNGRYVIDHRETQNGSVSADYIETVFTLKTAELPDGEVYVNGAFNNWRQNDRNRMTYDPASGSYRAAILLKQGVYNYVYAVARTSPQPLVDESLLEGNFSQTENDYEVFVYHRPPAGRADQLVAYRKVGFGKRR